MENTYTFIGTDITNVELTNWLLGLAKQRKVKVTDIRYFGSRRFGTPRPDSDIDVYLTTPKGRKHFGNGVLFTEQYKKDNKTYQIEIHAFEDWGDGFVPTHLVGNEALNEIASNGEK